jgi:hypothetical protein
MSRSQHHHYCESETALREIHTLMLSHDAEEAFHPLSEHTIFESIKRPSKEILLLHVRV